MVVQGQLVKPPVDFSDLYEERIHSLIRQKLLKIYEQNINFQFMIFTLAKDYCIVWPLSGTLTFNLPEQMFQMNNCAKLF